MVKFLFATSMAVSLFMKTLYSYISEMLGFLLLTISVNLISDTVKTRVKTIPERMIPTGLPIFLRPSKLNFGNYVA